MYRILFMPLLRIPSGHHHVADSIKDRLNQLPEDFQCEKVELLSYSYGNLETLLSSIYLKSIHILPGIYSQIYNYVVKNKKTNKRFYLYEWLFLKKVHYLLEELKPDLIICTHSLPSYILERLKKKGLWSGRVINVYTDYFINNLWGIGDIDYHFVPSLHIKNELLLRGVKPHQIFLTGIPIHSLFKEEKNIRLKDDKYTVLISGGNMGAGSIQQLLDHLNPTGAILYKVLCGKNEKLFHYIKILDHSYIKPIRYLSSKQEMNQLYDKADAIITKPGGVTITESLWKKIPIFVFEALPGQEEINLNYLKSQNLIFHLENWCSSNHLEENIINILKNDISQFQKHLEVFYNCFEKNDEAQIIQDILMP